MTVKEISEILGVKENYVRTHWQKICDSCSKRGVILYKEGRGETAAYGIKPEWDCKVYWNYDDIKNGG